MTEICEIRAVLSKPDWRINNLYKIVDKRGIKRTFKLNWAQKYLYNNSWYFNAILKGRQIGISTYVILLFLDRCLFNSDVTAGIIAHTREDAEKLFKKIKLAYECLPDDLKSVVKATTDSARELQFSNGSSLRVGTSMRGQTIQYLHISEFGKICAHYPEKAEEIITGSLNTVEKGQYIFIESTAEGSSGYFYDICNQSKNNKNTLTPLDYKFFFFPWHKEPSYVMSEYVRPPKEMVEHFEKLESQGIFLGDAQKSWYVKKYEVLGDSIFQEFPSFPEEAFKGSAKGLFYGKLLVEATLEKRVSHVPYDNNCPVHISVDLGFGDHTAIWFFQIAGKEIHLIDFHQDSGKSLADYIHIIKSKPYTYGEFFAPHDIRVHEYSSGASRWEVAKNLGINFTVVDKVSVQEGIDAVRNIFPRLWINKEKCAEGIRMLENYRREWDVRAGKWSDKPLHDFTSNAADALRYLALGIKKMEFTGSGSIENDYKALKRYWGY